MATVDMTTKDYPGNFNVGFRPTPGQIGYISRTIDATVTPLATADDYKIMTISAPNGGFVRTTLVPHTVESAADTIDIGTTAGGAEITDDLSLATATPTALTTVILAEGDTSIYVSNPSAAIAQAIFSVNCEVFLKGL